jgi:integration host factor subunit beta
MTKNDLVLQIAKRMHMQQTDVRRIVQMTLDSITEVLATGEQLELQNFGVFEVKNRKPRKARNWNTGEPVMAAARKAVTFRASKFVEERVNGIERPANSNAKKDKIDSRIAGDFVFEHRLLDAWSSL